MNSRQLGVAFVVVFLVPPLVMFPFRDELAQIVPQPPLWTSITMLLGLLVIFALSVLVWDQSGAQNTGVSDEV